MAEVTNVRRVNADFGKRVWGPFKRGYRIEAVIQAQKLAMLYGHILIELAIKKDLAINLDPTKGPVRTTGKLTQLIKRSSDHFLWQVLYKSKLIDKRTRNSLQEFNRSFRNPHAHDFWAITDDKKKVEVALKEMERNYKLLSEAVITFK